MTTPDPKPAYDPAEFLRDYRAHEARAADLQPGNKTRLFDTLRPAGVTRVVVTFDGYADSGQIESIEAYAGDSPCALPETTVEIHYLPFRAVEPTVTVETAKDAVETLAYALLEQTHAGWENNDGSYGEFVFDVEGDMIELDFSGRFTDTTHYGHSW